MRFFLFSIQLLYTLDAMFDVKLRFKEGINMTVFFGLFIPIIIQSHYFVLVCICFLENCVFSAVECFILYGCPFTNTDFIAQLRQRNSFRQLADHLGFLPFWPFHCRSAVLFSLYRKHFQLFVSWMR